MVTLPPCSPELQPVEPLWKLTDAPLVNRSFASLDDLIAFLAPHCAWLETQPDRITQQTVFHWWLLCMN